MFLYIVQYPVLWTAQRTLQLPLGRPVPSDTNSTSPENFSHLHITGPRSFSITSRWDSITKYYSGIRLNLLCIASETWTTGNRKVCLPCRLPAAGGTGLHRAANTYGGLRVATSRPQRAPSLQARVSATVSLLRRSSRPPVLACRTKERQWWRICSLSRQRGCTVWDNRWMAIMVD